MKEVRPRYFISWNHMKSPAMDVTSLIQFISLKSRYLHYGLTREKFFSTCLVSYEGKTYAIGEDLAAIYGDGVITGNKEAQKRVRAFFTANFPMIPPTAKLAKEVYGGV